jgi:hypothetical protein
LEALSQGRMAGSGPAMTERLGDEAGRLGQMRLARYGLVAGAGEVLAGGEAVGADVPLAGA